MHVSLLSSVRFKGEIFIICNKKRRRKHVKTSNPLEENF